MKKNTNKEQDYFFANWLEGKITDAELQEKISEKDFIESLKLRKSFDVINELNTPLDKTLSSIKSKLNSNKSVETKTKIISLYTKWAVSIAASLILFFGISNYLKGSDKIFNSGFGEQKTIALLDGSEVILNAKSKLKYNKNTWKNKRELYLDGEAYFKVTKGSTFTVNTKNGSVTVLGTQFNVNSDTNYFKVICYEGKVKVENNNTTHILTPGKGMSNLNGFVTKINTDITAPKWVNGESSFDNIPLTIVINELEKQFNISIKRNNIDTTARFTGSFNNKKLNLALASVFRPMNIKYQIKGKNIELSK